MQVFRIPAEISIIWIYGKRLKHAKIHRTISFYFVLADKTLS